MRRTKRNEILDQRPVNRDTFIKPLPEAGLIAMDSPDDPVPELTIRDGEIISMDGKCREEFDLIDHFIASHAIDIEKAEQAMKMESREIARMLVDINVPRSTVLDLSWGCTPAKLTDICRWLNVLEMMVGLAKMRARRSPANQAHVTNRKENPALLAADAAEAALRGFAEVETT